MHRKALFNHQADDGHVLESRGLLHWDSGTLTRASFSPIRVNRRLASQSPSLERIIPSSQALMSSSVVFLAGEAPRRSHVYVDLVVMPVSTGQWPCQSHGSVNDAGWPWRREHARRWVPMLWRFLHSLRPSARTLRAVIL